MAKDRDTAKVYFAEWECNPSIIVESTDLDEVFRLSQNGQPSAKVRRLGPAAKRSMMPGDVVVIGDDYTGARYECLKIGWKKV